MKTRTTTLLGPGLLLAGTLFLAGCDNTPVPLPPGIEEQEDAENQDRGNDQSTYRDNGQDEEQDDN